MLICYFRQDFCYLFIVLRFVLKPHVDGDVSYFTYLALQHVALPGRLCCSQGRQVYKYSLSHLMPFTDNLESTLTY